ncbi:hypothetical protein [Kocuria gwangalliensis]
MTHMKARFWATSLELTAAVALTGCGAVAAAPATASPASPTASAPAAAPSSPTAQASTQGPGGYPVVAPENSPQVGLDPNGKYAPGLKLASMDQGRLFFAYPQNWDVIATSDTSMSIRTRDGSVEGGIEIRQAGAPEPDMPQMTHTRTVYGQAQGPDHAANVVVGRTDRTTPIGSVGACRTRPPADPAWP